MGLIAGALSLGPALAGGAFLFCGGTDMLGPPLIFPLDVARPV